MRFKVLVLLALASLFVFGASAQDETPLKIGILSDQSGGLALYGGELEMGFKLGLLYEAGIDPEEYDTLDAALADVTINGRPVELLIRDTASNPDTGSQLARELVEQEGVEILVGAPSSGVTVGLQQVALDYDVLLFAGPGASPAITGANFNLNTFRACRTTTQDSLALASFATELGAKWVILASDNEFGRGSAAGYVATLGAYGVEFVSDPIYAPGETTDFTAYLQQVKDSGADVLLPIWAGDTTIALNQQLKESGVGDTMGIIGAINSNDIVKLSDPSVIGSVAPGVYHYTFPNNEINDWLVAKHLAVTTAMGAADYPDLFTECGFATAQALTQAVIWATSTLPVDLSAILEGLTWEGPKGTYFLRPGDHQVMEPMYVARLVNLDDPEFKFWELIGEIDQLSSNPPCALPEAFADRCALNDAYVTDVVTPALEAAAAEE